MASWPNTLPQLPEADGYSEKMNTGVIRTDMDTGPAKVRRRFTAVTADLTVKFAITQAQSGIFDAWFVGTLYGGAITFEWTNPRTNTSETFRIKGEPSYSNQDTQLFLTLQLEKMP